MKVAFRVDASPRIGTGHIMRCLTLAAELSRRGAKTLFLSRHLPDHLAGMLAAAGHDLTRLMPLPREQNGSQSEQAGWLGGSQTHDAAETLEALSGGSWDWIVVDHYGLDAAWETLLRREVPRIMAIDDIADRLHDCDLLLDQNLHADERARYDGKVPPASTLLLGPRYALLREEFRTRRQEATPRDGRVARILVFFGGMDLHNYTGSAVNALTGLRLLHMHVDVVVGQGHPQLEVLREQCARAGFSYHVQTARMADLMVAADLAIGAGGIATWERCCLGLPALCICTAENQREQLAAAAAAGLVCAPDGTESPNEVMLMIRRHTETLLENPSLLRFISCAAMRAVDGRGTSRVAIEMGSWDVQLRVATPADSRKLFEWRNHPSVRAVSRIATPIDWDAHQRWLASVLSAADRALLIGERDGTAVGVVRFDVSNAEAEISIYLVPGEHPPGEGGRLLRGAERWLAANRPAVTQVGAQVLAGNERSARLFSGTGYRLESTRYVKWIDRR